MTVAGRSWVIRAVIISVTCLQIVWSLVKTIYDTTDQSALTVHYYWTENLNGIMRIQQMLM